MFLVGIAQALRSGVLGRSYEAPLRKAWSGPLTRTGDAVVTACVEMMRFEERQRSVRAEREER